MYSTPSYSHDEMEEWVLLKNSRQRESVSQSSIATYGDWATVPHHTAGLAAHTTAATMPPHARVH